MASGMQKATSADSLASSNLTPHGDRQIAAYSHIARPSAIFVMLVGSLGELFNRQMPMICLLRPYTDTPHTAHTLTEAIQLHDDYQYPVPKE